MTEQERALAFSLLCRELVNLDFRSNRVTARLSRKGRYASEHFKHHPDVETAIATAILRAIELKEVEAP
jgi:hypothetical protein